MTHWNRTSGGSGLTLAENYPAGLEPFWGHSLATDKIPLGSNQSGSSVSGKLLGFFIDGIAINHGQVSE